MTRQSGPVRSPAVRRSDILRNVRLQLHLLFQAGLVGRQDLHVDLLELAMRLLHVIELLEAIVASPPQHLEVQVEYSPKAIYQWLDGNRVTKHAGDVVDHDFRQRADTKRQD